MRPVSNIAESHGIRLATNRHSEYDHHVMPKHRYDNHQAPFSNIFPSPPGQIRHSHI